MPTTCYVPGCKSGYDKMSTEKRHFFQPPKDSTMFSKWSRAIGRRDLALSDKSRVCDLHFAAELIKKCDNFVIDGEKVEILRLKWRLDRTAVPHIFPKVPKYLSRNVVVKRFSYQRQLKKSDVPTSRGSSIVHSGSSSSPGTGTADKLKVTCENRRELILKQRINYLQRKVTLVRRKLKQEMERNAKLERELQEIKSSNNQNDTSGKDDEKGAGRKLTGKPRRLKSMIFLGRTCNANLKQPPTFAEGALRREVRNLQARARRKDRRIKSLEDSILQLRKETVHQTVSLKY